MSIQQEEILIDNYTTGTTLLFFSTHFDDIKDVSGVDMNPCIVHMNSLGSPVKVSTFDGSNLWSMNRDNIYVPISSVSPSHLTGYSYSQTIPEMISVEKIERYRDKFEESFREFYQNSTGATPNHTEYVFASYNEMEDMFVNIKLNRTFGTLDTLNVYNNLVNSMPTQESNTGVVFGRLMARQEIKDPEGNNISIPLRNVPIGIFNSSNEYPSSTSMDSNGDRIFLNIKESSSEDEYFNFESFSADTGQYLKSASQFKNVPDHYKYITTTNENGEFIIYDVPVGNQIAVFEVDLFKQGLTKDEIALNFFPFPSNDSSPLDSIPSFSFKQFPVSVVPSWGTIQTGYTELNVTVNYDLRKWATYYIPPVSYDGKKIGSSELSNYSPALNVDIRDMSKEGFPKRNIPVVEIHDIYNKDDSQTLLWEGEFAQLKKTVKFYEHGFRAFKVKANMYDPNGFRTDKNGNPRNHPSSKGVWLSGYQFKLYYNQPESIFRTTGFQMDWGFPGDVSWRGRDNFHLNRGDTSSLKNAETQEHSFAPYDRPWSHLYPDKYKIPSKPSVKNFNRNTGVGRLPSSPPYYLEQPEYKDGDLVGLTYSPDKQSGGFGFQYSWDSKNWFNNRFSKEITASYVYKYESGVAWNEKYANNFQPSNGGIFAGASSVVNGEKFQRVECGYSYWLRPDGWPPISVESWGDTVYTEATKPGVGVSGEFNPGVIPTGASNGSIKVQGENIPVDVYNLSDKDSSLALDFNATFPEGALNIYRVIDPMDRMPQAPEVVPTYAVFNFSDFYFQRGRNQFRIRTGYSKASGEGDDNYFSKLSDPGSSNHAFHGYNNLKIKIKNNGSVDVVIEPIGIELLAGETREFNMYDMPLDGASYRFPGNSSFDFESGKYMLANYSITFTNIKLTKNNGQEFAGSQNNAITSRVINSTVVPAEVDPSDVYYLTTSYGNVRTSYKDAGINKGCRTSKGFPTLNNVMDARMNGALFQVPGTTGGGYIKEMRFIKNGINPYCGGASLKGGIHSITFERL